MSIISDVASSPQVAVPVALGVSGANILTFLPTFINIATALYITMLVFHKGWVWYREVKGKQAVVDDTEIP